MDIEAYFANVKGFGVLASADAEGRVNAAVYARPHVLEDGTLAMVMRDRLTRHNLNQNPHAAFLFKEEGSGYRGRRLHLTRLREDTDPERIAQFKRRPVDPEREDEKGALFLVTFRVDKVLPLVGAGD